MPTWEETKEWESHYEGIKIGRMDAAAGYKRGCRRRLW